MKASENKHNLTLYIHSRSPLSKYTLQNLKKISAHKTFHSKFNLNIVEIDKHPDVAEKLSILATPLLICQSSKFNVRILGNLSDFERVYDELGLDRDHHE